MINSINFIINSTIIKNISNTNISNIISMLNINSSTISIFNINIFNTSTFDINIFNINTFSIKYYCF